MLANRARISTVTMTLAQLPLTQAAEVQNGALQSPLRYICFRRRPITRQSVLRCGLVFPAPQTIAGKQLGVSGVHSDPASVVHSAIETTHAESHLELSEPDPAPGCILQEKPYKRRASWGSQSRIPPQGAYSNRSRTSGKPLGALRCENKTKIQGTQLIVKRTNWEPNWF